MFFFFKQKTAYEMRISDWSSDVCSSDLLEPGKDIRITLLEGSDRILSALPEKMSAAAHKLLVERGVAVQTSVRVAEVRQDALIDSDGRSYPVDLCVWAAGIEAPAFLKDLGLETNRINQVVVDAGLRTSDPAIYAMGDCAQTPWHGEQGALPARAQVAHQQASFLLPEMEQRIKGGKRQERIFRFRSEEHTSELQSLMRTSYAVLCLKKHT